MLKTEVQRMVPVVFANVIFPTWFISALPSFLWLIIIPANFLVDSLVLYFWMKARKIENKTQIWKKSILRIWIFGFLSDFLASAILMLFYFGWFAFWENLLSMDWIASWISIVAYGWGSSIYGLIGTLIGMVMIYLFNRQWSFKKTTLTSAQIQNASFWLALITAPWMLIVPADLVLRWF